MRGESREALRWQGQTLQTAEDALDTALAEFLAEGVDPAQLARIKKQLRASQVYARDDVQQLANLYGRSMTAGLTVEDIVKWPDILQAVTEDEIMRAAKTIFSNRQNAVTGWLTTEQEGGQ